MSLSIRLTRVSRTYRPGDVVSGVVVVDNSASSSPLAHGGLVVSASGRVLPAPPAAPGAPGAGGGEPEALLAVSIDAAPPGRFPAGARVELPFEFVLARTPAGRPGGRGGAAPPPGGALRESYRGVFVSVKYSVAAAARRGGLLAALGGGGDALEAEPEDFFVEVPSEPRPPPGAPVPFELTPAALENVKPGAAGAVPAFCVRGALHSTTCALGGAFTGDVTVAHAASRLRGVELQLVRVEGAGGPGGARESTEIQRLQVADGDPAHGLPLPLYMLFPRLFTCASVVTPTYSVTYEANLIVAFEDGYVATLNVPLLLYR